MSDTLEAIFGDLRETLCQWAENPQRQAFLLPLESGEDVTQWLRRALQTPRWADEVTAAARRQRIRRRSLQRAKKALGVQSLKVSGPTGSDARWLWYLPNEEGSKSYKSNLHSITQAQGKEL